MGNGCCKGEVANRSETRYGDGGIEEEYHGVAMDGTVRCEEDEWVRSVKGARISDRVKRHLEEEPLRVGSVQGAASQGGNVHSAAASGPLSQMSSTNIQDKDKSEKNKLLHHSSASSRSSLGDSLTWVASDIDTTVPSIPPSPFPPALQPWARLLSLDPHFDSIDVVDEQFSFGRSKSCSFTFPNNMVSHIQFKLHFVDRRTQTVEIEDVFSTNGTFVYGFTSQGKIAGRQSLQHGDQITFQIYTPAAPTQDEAKKKKKKKAMAAGYIFHLLHVNEQVYDNVYMGRDVNALAKTHATKAVGYVPTNPIAHFSATHPGQTPSSAASNLVKLPDIRPEIEPQKTEPKFSSDGDDRSSPLLRTSTNGLSSDNGQGTPLSYIPTPQMKYKISNCVLGTGANSAVHLGLVQVTGELVAVKRLRKGPVATSDFQLNCLTKEIEILSRLSHSNIVKYIGAQVNDLHFDVLLEFVPGGSIASLIKKFGALDESVTRNYLVQILAGLRYLHDNNVVHMDIKGANILVTSEGKCRLTDFGASKTRASVISGKEDHVERVAGPFCGTPLYMAPEVAREAVFTPKSDVWSLGCTLIEMSSGRLPWEEKGFENSFAVVNFHMRNTTETPQIPASSKLGPLGRDFCQMCFRMNSEGRPSAAESLRHVFITSSIQADAVSEYNPNQSQLTFNDFESISLNGMSPPPSQPPSGHYSLPSIAS